MTPTTRSLARLSAALAATALLAKPAHAESIAEFLRAFHADPAAMMERLPAIVGEDGVARPQGFVSLAQEERRRSAIAEARRAFVEKLGLGGAAPTELDDASKLVDPGTTVERNLGNLQAAGYANLTAPAKPWADSYWPTYRGQIAYRYASSARGESKIWAENYSFALANPAAAIAASGDGARISLLSPAEKYDYVMGDDGFTLTSFAWARGKASSDEGYGVATWMGICHGWSAASSMGMPFIGQKVTVLSTKGVPVTFYPQDIKALQSMRWANGAPQARFVGGRCKVAHPARNAYGRILDPGCYDTNPATWHLAVTNQLGKNHRSFVFDGDLGEQVWNFPLQSARYRYFNPQTLEEAPSLQAALAPIERYTVDKFKEFRSKDARSVVGIYMDVTYPIEIEPGASRVFDAPTKTVRYIYDLELDGSGSVVGGEWYSNAHPDFLWTFDSNAQAMAFDENVILGDPWSNNGPVPMAWTSYAQRASARGIPLYGFLEKLIEAAGPVHQP